MTELYTTAHTKESPRTQDSLSPNNVFTRGSDSSGDEAQIAKVSGIYTVVAYYGSRKHDGRYWGAGWREESAYWKVVEEI